MDIRDEGLLCDSVEDEFIDPSIFERVLVILLFIIVAIFGGRPGDELFDY